MAKRNTKQPRATTNGVKATVNPVADEESESLSQVPAAPQVEQVTIEDFTLPTPPDSEASPFDDGALFTVPSEAPKKRGRPKGYRPSKKKTAPDADPQTISFVFALLDSVGASLAGEAGLLSDTERTLLNVSLTEVQKRYSEQVEKYSAYIYPVCGVLAVGMWGKRILDVRTQNEQTTKAETNQQPNTAQPTPRPTDTNANGVAIFADPILSNGVNRIV